VVILGFRGIVNAPEFAQNAKAHTGIDRASDWIGKKVKVILLD